MRSFLLAALTTGCGFEISAGRSFDGGTDSTVDAGADSTVAADARIDADPSADTDGDTVVDPADNCPDVANVDQRDFDGDQRGDACDRCPHVADTADPDDDDDGVGDSCDPRASDSGDARVRWTSFHAASEISGWSTTGTWSVSMGVVPTTSSNLRALQPTSPTGELAAATMVHVDEAFSANDRAGLCMADNWNTSHYYCCELYGANGGLEVRVENRWSGGSDSSIQTWPGSIAVGTRIAISGALLADATRCVFEEVGAATRLVRTGERGGATPTGSPSLYTDGVIARFRYLFVVSVGSD